MRGVFVPANKRRVRGGARAHIQYRLSDDEQCDYNVYRPDECNLICIVAYAVEHVPGEEPHVLQINTAIECHVADIRWEE